MNKANVSVVGGNSSVTPSLLNYPYHPPFEGQIAIVAYNPVPWINQDWTYPLTPEVFERIIDCGFNMAQFGTTPASTPEHPTMTPGLMDGSLAAIQGLNLRAVINASSFLLMPFPEPSQPSAEVFRNVMEAFVKKNRDNQIIWGWNLMDEPKFINWNGFDNPVNREGVSDLLESYNEYIRLSPDKISFFNLACTVGEDVIGEIIAKDESKYDTDLKKYYAYLKLLNSKFRPALWCFDFYPVKLTSQDGEIVVKRDYYLYLEAFKVISNNSGRPFWAYILSTPHTIYKEDGTVEGIYPDITEGILRYQAFTALAYGAKGIVYWTYGQTLNKTYKNGMDYEIYYSAPVNSSNQITPIWYAAQTINNEIKAYNDFFYDAKCQRVAHAYNPLDTQQIEAGYENVGFYDTTLFKAPFYCLTAVSVPSNGKGVLVSYMTKGNSKYIVFVSHDPVNSQKGTIGINLSYNWHFFETLAEPVESTPENATNSTMDFSPSSEMAQMVSFTLKPGGYKVLFFSEK